MVVFSTAQLNKNQQRYGELPKIVVTTTVDSLDCPKTQSKQIEKPTEDIDSNFLKKDISHLLEPDKYIDNDSGVETSEIEEAVNEDCIKNFISRRQQQRRVQKEKGYADQTEKIEESKPETLLSAPDEKSRIVRKRPKRKRSNTIPKNENDGGEVWSEIVIAGKNKFCKHGDVNSAEVSLPSLLRFIRILTAWQCFESKLPSQEDAIDSDIEAIHKHLKESHFFNFRTCCEELDETIAVIPRDPRYAFERLRVTEDTSVMAYELTFDIHCKFIASVLVICTNMLIQYSLQIPVSSGVLVSFFKERLEMLFGEEEIRYQCQTMMKKVWKNLLLPKHCNTLLTSVVNLYLCVASFMEIEYQTSVFYTAPLAIQGLECENFNQRDCEKHSLKDIAEALNIDWWEKFPKVRLSQLILSEAQRCQISELKVCKKWKIRNPIKNGLIWK